MFLKVVYAQCVLINVFVLAVAGESFRYLGQTVDGVLAISNYRLYVHKSTNEVVSVPLGLIESAVTRELNQVIISCKDASTVK